MLRATKRFAAFLLVVLTAPPCLAGVKVPDWVHNAATQSLPTYDPETDAVVLLDDTNYEITAPLEYTEHYRRVVKILRPDGREQGRLALYLRGGDKLLSLHAWTIDGSGREYELKDKDFVERSPYSFALYSDIHLQTAVAPASNPGSVIAVEYEVHRHHWLQQLDWFIQEELPVREVRLGVLLPPGWVYKAFWGAIPPAQPVQEGGSRLEWAVRDVAGIKDEPFRPSVYSLAAHMALAYFQPGSSISNANSWESLGRWYSGLTAGRRSPSAEISAKAHELTSGKVDFDGKLRTLASFVQSEIRYVAIEIGIGGYQPHNAGDIFRYRYGDCKDKATLLSSLLEEAGIRSDYVLINTERGMTKPEVPSARFNHAILAIEVPPETRPDAYRATVTSETGKKYLIFDPTDGFTPLGELRSDLQDSYALLVTDSGGELIHTPLLSPDSNTLLLSGRFTLTPDGDLLGEVVETRSGDHASRERAALTYSDQAQRLQHLERRLNRSIQGFTLEAFKVQQLKELPKKLILTYEVTTPRYAQVRGPVMLVRPRVLGEKSFVVEQKPRHYAWELGGTSREVDDYEIQLPEGYVVDDVPDPVKLDMGFASYQSKIEVAGAKLRYHREYVVRDLALPADRISELRTLEGRIGADEDAAVILKRAN
jgi:transglutaminase-like putative cysteine protease